MTHMVTHGIVDMDQTVLGLRLCLLVPSLLNIAQFLDEVPDHEHTDEE